MLARGISSFSKALPSALQKLVEPCSVKAVQKGNLSTGKG